VQYLPPIGVTKRILHPTVEAESEKWLPIEIGIRFRQRHGLKRSGWPTFRSSALHAPITYLVILPYFWMADVQASACMQQRIKKNCFTAQNPYRGRGQQIFGTLSSWATAAWFAGAGTLPTI
jgi:hypothetical protein